MNQVIFTKHATDRLHERKNIFMSEADLKLLATVAWQSRHKRLSSAAFRLNKKINLHGQNRDSICVEAGGYFFIFARKSYPVLITVYAI